MEPVGVIFYRDGNWLHCGFRRGQLLIDSQPELGVTMRALPPGGQTYWLGDDEGAAAWHAAWTRLGERFELCSGFVCQCMGGRCILPSGLEDRLRKRWDT